MDPLWPDPGNWGNVGNGAQAFALLVSLALLWMTARDRHREREAQRRAQAEHVSAWVDDRYVRASTTGRLERRTFAHLRNTGTQPVYDVSALIGHGYTAEKVRSIGTLGIPSLVPVLPPDADLDFEITEPLRHFVIEGMLRAEVKFRDPANVYWFRRFDGGLVEEKANAGRLVPSNDEREHAEAMAQLGEFSPDNPASIAIVLLSALQMDDYKNHLSDLRALVTPESLESWGDLSEVREMLSGKGLATFPEYPAPGVCYLRLPPSPSATLGRAVGPVPIDAAILTLQQRPDLDGSWRIHSVGLPCPPEHLPPIRLPGRDR